MVSITTNLPSSDSLDERDVRVWLAGLAVKRSKEEMDKLFDACELAFEVHQEGLEGTGESTLRHALAVAEILDEMELDWETLAAAILHDVLPENLVELDSLEKRFGSGVACMVRDMSRIGFVARARNEGRINDQADHTENLRRMLLSIADDIRVVLIVLAERLHIMRILKNLPEDIRIAETQETKEIYAPLANRLGIWQIKWELEDLCLRYLEPSTYKDLASKLDGRRVEREEYIDEIMDLLQEKFQRLQISAEITGRPKHIYSIWKKMTRKAVPFEQIFDLRAVRVLVDSVADCYAAIGVVHGLWRHIPGEFDDYIATPKANMYRSIHTAVIGPGDKTLEVQIRTHKMHEHAELGVAAHWRYKESGGKGDAEFERRIALMRNWLDVKDDPSESDDFVENLRSEFESRQIYVLTPNGKVMELAKGATPVDFAYAIHSDVGHRCRGAKIDGRITTLTQPLESGQMVEVLTTKEGGPSRDWLSPHLGYLKTNKARNRVRHWFKQQDYDQHLQTGKSSLEKEVSRLGMSKPDLALAVKRFNFQREDDLLAAIGRGEVSPVQVAGMGHSPRHGEQRQLALPVPSIPARKPGKSKQSSRGEVSVAGVDDLLVHMARCCKPVPNDSIIGFITRGRGVSVHRGDCKMVANLPEEEQGRLVEVDWIEQSDQTAYQVDIRVIAGDRKGLLRDISALLANEEVDVCGVNTQSNKRTDRATMLFTVEIVNMRQLSRIIDKISQLPDVLSIRRQV